MTITAISANESGAVAALATSVSHAMANSVDTNNLITVVCARFATSSDTFTSAYCTQSAGTAGLTSFVLDRSSETQIGIAQFCAVGIWSAIVRNPGTCTVQIAGVPALSTLMLAHGEYTGNWDASRSEVASNNTATSTSATTGAVQSSKAALWMGGLSLGIPGILTITEKATYALLFKDQTNGTGSIARNIMTNGSVDSAAWTLSLSQPYLALLNVYREAGGMPVTFPVGVN